MFTSIDAFCRFSSNLIKAHREVCYKERQFTIYIPVHYLGDLMKTMPIETFQHTVNSWWTSNPEALLGATSAHFDIDEHFTITVLYANEGPCTTWEFSNSSALLLSHLLEVYYKSVGLGKIKINVPKELVKEFDALESHNIISSYLPSEADLELCVNRKFVVVRA